MVNINPPLGALPYPLVLTLLRNQREQSDPARTQVLNL